MTLYCYTNLWYWYILSCTVRFIVTLVPEAIYKERGAVKLNLDDDWLPILVTSM